MNTGSTTLNREKTKFSYQNGVVYCSYDTLIECLGMPTQVKDSRHSRVEWETDEFKISDWQSDDELVYDNTKWFVYGDSTAIFKAKEFIDNKLGSQAKYITRYEIIRYF